jgi:hypothetical protein
MFKSEGEQGKRTGLGPSKGGAALKADIAWLESSADRPMRRRLTFREIRND